MTPKEKAKELLDKYSKYQSGYNYKYKAAQCAFIAVDELLLLITYQPTIDYWNEVKQEIKKQ
jgi:hypothetical protein